MELLSNKKVGESIQKVSVRMGAKETFNILWLADLHFDNPDTNKSKLKKLIDNNPECYICIGGDAFDLMDGFGYPRQSKSRISKNNHSDNYVNDIVNNFIDFFAPYASRILCINFGNHESSYLKRNGIDLAQYVVSLLNANHGGNIVLGDYAGYIVLSFYYNNDKKSKSSKVIYYTHSSGSIGKRSKGALAIDILKGQHPSADVIIWEHDHESLIKPETIEVLDRNRANITSKDMWFCSVPTMKDEFSGQKRGFHHEKNMGKRVIGGMKINFSFLITHLKISLIIEPQLKLV